MAWPTVVAIMASYVVSQINRPKMNPPRPASAGDLQMPLAEHGTRQYVVFGDVWIRDPVVLTYGNFRTQKIKTRGGKKGIGGYWMGLIPGHEEERERKAWHAYTDTIPEWDGVSALPDSGGTDIDADTWIPNKPLATD